MPKIAPIATFFQMALEGSAFSDAGISGLPSDLMVDRPAGNMVGTVRLRSQFPLYCGNPNLRVLRGKLLHHEEPKSGCRSGVAVRRRGGVACQGAAAACLSGRRRRACQGSAAARRRGRSGRRVGVARPGSRAARVAGDGHDAGPGQDVQRGDAARGEIAAAIC